MLTAALYIDTGPEFREVTREELFAVSEGLRLFSAVDGDGGIDVEVIRRLRSKLPSEDRAIRYSELILPTLVVADLHFYLTDREIELDDPIVDGTDRENYIGASALLSGIAVVNTASGLTTIKKATAHEAAHATGFMVPGADHAVEDDSAHCADEDCLLFPLLTNDKRKQTCFCENCAKEMKIFMPTNLEFMRVIRQANGLHTIPENTGKESREAEYQRIRQGLRRNRTT